MNPTKGKTMNALCKDEAPMDAQFDQSGAYRPGYWLKRTYLKKLTPPQKGILEAIGDCRRQEISRELRIWGLRSAIKLHGHRSLASALSLGLKRVDPRSLAALAKAGFIELSIQKSHRINRHVDPFTRAVCFKDHYETSYCTKLTTRGVFATRWGHNRCTQPPQQITDHERQE